MDRSSVNFHSKQSKAFDELSASSRKLLTRIDSQKYVETLEDLVENRLGIDLQQEMRSQPTWRKVDL